MKALKVVAIILLVILGIIFIPPLFMNGAYSVERQVTINKSKSELFDYLKILKNQHEYSVWSKLDPNMSQTYKGTDGTVGAIYRWEGNKDVGIGEQEIIAIKEGERIDFEMRFYEPFETTDFAYFEFVPENDSVTVVKWGFFGEMKGAMKWFGVFMDMEDMVGTSLQEGLDNMKKQQEAV